MALILHKACSYNTQEHSSGKEIIMALFGKKREDIKTEPACACNGAVETYEAEGCCGRAEEIVTGIKVLGSGCKNCHELFENAKKAAADLGLPVEVEYITDMEKVTSYGVMSMPALVVNEKVVSMGKVLKPVEVIKLLGKLGF